MLALDELQTRFRDIVLGASADGLKGVIADERLGHARRLNVYRNNTTILLREALATNFAVTHALVGEDFFTNLARAFLRTHPPHSPCLFEYGEDFAAFIKTFPGLQDLPYLSDVARLEWAANEAYHEADAPALNAAHLADIIADDYGRLSFTLHPTARVVASPYPIHAIWALHQEGAEPNTTVDLNHGEQAVLITRPGTEIILTVLGDGEAAFLSDVADGATLGDAFAAAQSLHDTFDAARALTTLFVSGALCAFDLPLKEDHHDTR